MVKSVFTKRYATFRRVLKAERTAKDITQVTLGTRLGMTQTEISKIERGERRLDVVEFIAMVRALGSDPAEVIAKVEASYPKRRGKA